MQSLRHSLLQPFLPCHPPMVDVAETSSLSPTTVPKTNLDHQHNQILLGVSPFSVNIFPTLAVHHF